MTDRTRPWGREAALVLLWAVLLLALLAAPHLAQSPTPGADQTRNTIRLALVYYGGAAALMLLLRPGEWGAGRGRLARWGWTLAWVAYAIHVGLAFHFYHDWSHAHAVEHTARRSGFGPGIYVSHLFTVAWGLDAASWWLRPDWYARRPAWIDRALHGFMAFIIFNGTVVFETGVARAGGLGLFAGLGAFWLWARLGPARGAAARAPASARHSPPG